MVRHATFARLYARLDVALTAVVLLAVDTGVAVINRVVVSKGT